MGLAGAESATESTFLIGTAVAGVGVSNITHRVRRGEKYGQGCSMSQGRGDVEVRRSSNIRTRRARKWHLAEPRQGKMPAWVEEQNKLTKLHVELRRERE